ncbi:taste receptor type 2 member 14-like [Lepus europaeus]|uniref:taste receptor type 2 member 14-like n=1 Tax=Lepus europaeus TaxID=9983 RepID=UPI002B485E55|nr:taste receptor type 2 member 14-like [Lepus europaeus]
MASVVLTVFAVILSVEFIIGNAGNGFIALVNCLDWVKGRKISAADQLLTALAISRIGLLWYIFFSGLLSVFYPALLFTENLTRLRYMTWIVTNHFSMWLATSLSIFYFLKIANFSNSTFLFLKWRVENVILVTLFMSFVLLILNIATANIYIDVWIEVHRGNLSYTLSHSAHLFGKFLCIETMFVMIPFSLSLAAFLLLIFSLWRHLTKVQLNATGSRDTSTTAHVRGLQTVITFLALYTIFFLALLLQTWHIYLLEKRLSILICQILEMFYPSGHSCFMILGNNKLRQASLSVLRWLSANSEMQIPSFHLPFR